MTRLVRSDAARRPRSLLAVVVPACALLMACAMGSGQDCDVTPPTSCSAPALHYANVQPIIQQRCTSCHSGTTEQWPLTDYSHVASWYDIIPAELVACRMPPPDAGMGMTNEERMTLLTWLHCGFAE